VNSIPLKDLTHEQVVNLFLNKEDISEYVSCIKKKKVTGMLLTSVRSAKDLNYLDPNINSLYANTIFNYIVDWKLNGVNRTSLRAPPTAPPAATGKIPVQPTGTTMLATSAMIFIQDRRLLDATKIGDLSQVAHLLDIGANVNTKDEQVVFLILCEVYSDTLSI
jgi:hypothetical protein